MRLKSIKHVVLECNKLNPAPLEGEPVLAEAVGIAGEDRLIDLTRVTRHKQVLGIDVGN